MPRLWKFIVVIAALAVLIVFYKSELGAPGGGTGIEIFSVPLHRTRAEVVQSLVMAGFVKHAWALDLALTLRGAPVAIVPGGYNLSKSMNVWSVAGVLLSKSSLVWVTVPEGLRKEEIAGLLADALGWTEAQRTEWIALDTAQNSDYFEGVYFPETYLLPANDNGPDVAARLIAKFNEKFAPLAPAFAKQNVKWTTAVKIASLVQRESAGPDDMPLIAGIIWNRLLKNMPLQIDSTVQYARGDTGKGWWAPITLADEKIDSPYNTYLHTGLPPHPIANPGFEALAAVLTPTTTTCLYYLHDANRQIHCAATYAEHLQNINTYLSPSNP